MSRATDWKGRALEQCNDHAVTYATMAAWLHSCKGPWVCLKLPLSVTFFELALRADDTVDAKDSGNSSDPIPKRQEKKIQNQSRFARRLS